MKIAILTANLGNFDTPVDPVKQEVPGRFVEIKFHRFTDNNFPPIVGLTPRLQYRIPKMFGWEMFPDYDYYLWLDGGMSLQRSDCIKWYLDQIGDNDILLFRHPWRGTIKAEVDHIEEKLQQNHPYISSRYKNGLHKEMYDIIVHSVHTEEHPDYEDDILYASTAFLYKNTKKVRAMLMDWWFYQSRYFTCDQVALPYVVKKHDLSVTVIKESLFKIGYLSLVSHHK